MHGESEGKSAWVDGVFSAGGASRRCDEKGPLDACLLVLGRSYLTPLAKGGFGSARACAIPRGLPCFDLSGCLCSSAEVAASRVVWAWAVSVILTRVSRCEICVSRYESIHFDLREGWT